MCEQCNYKDLLHTAGLTATPNRLRVLEVIGANNCPLSAQDIFETLQRTVNINRVTVYRVLDLLVNGHVVERISSGGRSFFYGLAPNERHKPHPHFYCKHCGTMNCLNPDSVPVNVSPLNQTFAGQIDKIEIRIDGICKNCLRNTKTEH